MGTKSWAGGRAGAELSLVTSSVKEFSTSPLSLPLLSFQFRLSNPIMSLVDTAVVGAQSSIELAALGPATSLCDNLAYICGFLAQVDRRHSLHTYNTTTFSALFWLSLSLAMLLAAGKYLASNLLSRSSDKWRLRGWFYGYSTHQRSTAQLEKSRKPHAPQCLRVGVNV